MRKLQLAALALFLLMMSPMPAAKAQSGWTFNCYALGQTGPSSDTNCVSGTWSSGYLGMASAEAAYQGGGSMSTGVFLGTGCLHGTGSSFSLAEADQYNVRTSVDIYADNGNAIAGATRSRNDNGVEGGSSWANNMALTALGCYPIMQ